MAGKKYREVMTFGLATVHLTRLNETKTLCGEQGLIRASPSDRATRNKCGRCVSAQNQDAMQ